MMSKKMVKVICIIMAALMVLSVGAVVLQVIAVDGNASASVAVTETVDTDYDCTVTQQTDGADFLG